MPALARTGFQAEIVWLGVVPNRKQALESEARQSLTLGFQGPEGEDHGGLTRPSCSRVLGLYPRNTPIKNTRQVSIVSQEDLDSIAEDMGLDTLNPALVGANIVVRGIPDFTHVPPSSRLLAQSGASLVVDTENRPCTLPARPIETQHAGFGARFKSAAKARRGVTAWIEAEGTITLGDTLTLFIPDQPRWRMSETAVAR